MTDKELIEALERSAFNHDAMPRPNPSSLLRQAAARLRSLTAEPDEAMVERAARNIARLYGNPDECIQGSGSVSSGGSSFECTKRLWQNYTAHARAALAAAAPQEGE